MVAILLLLDLPCVVAVEVDLAQIMAQGEVLLVDLVAVVILTLVLLVVVV